MIALLLLLSAVQASSLFFPPFLLCMCARGRETDKERATDRDGETPRDPECTVNELLQLISFHIIECILRQRDLVR